MQRNAKPALISRDVAQTRRISQVELYPTRARKTFEDKPGSRFPFETVRAYSRRVAVRGNG